MHKKTMLLVFNPKSGQQEFSLNLFEVIEKFTRNGFLVTAYPTQAIRDAYNIIIEHAAQYDYLVCSGGDGTLNEAIDALMSMEKRPIFGYIPSGTTNDFAASLEIPRDILSAANLIISGESKPLDIGKLQNDHFSYVAAFGLFTDVSYDTPQGLKNALGHLAYLLEGVKRLASIQAFSCNIDIGEELISGKFVLGMVSNSLSIGGFRIQDKNTVKMDDGLFEILLIRKPRSFIDLQNIIASILNQEIYTNSIILRKAAQIKLSSDQPIKWTLDGEYGGEYTTVEIENCHRAVEILMPAQE